jgi:hypothetical protein
MKPMLKFSVSLRLCVVALMLSIGVAAQTVPAPKDVLGWTPGDDRKLASWSQGLEYFKKLDAASDRVQYQEIGKTTMGAPFVYVTISSPENIKNLERYKQINARLSDPRLFNSNDAEAKRLIGQGKTVVAITCSIHSTEVGGFLSSMLIAHRLASSNDPDIKKILDNTIVLLVPSLNPDGVDIVNNWYQKTLGTKFEGTDPPELYHKYVGHDDNRDWYAFTQVETQLTVDKILNPWHPQIVHDIHQQGPNGSRLFLPPYMEPVEPNVPKQIVEGYTELGKFISSELRRDGYQGITDNSTYDAWTPSRAYSHYHGAVRILSETASARLATPITVRFEQLRPGEHYDPRKEAPNFGPIWLGGEWHIRNITDYMTAAAFALLRHTANNREAWLNRFYSVSKDAVAPPTSGEITGFIIPRSDNSQGVIDILTRAGLKVDIASAFSYLGRTYPNGTAVVRAGQPYFGFARAMLQPEIYPDLKDENGNPTPPYDVTAHTITLLTGTEAIAAVSPLPRYTLGRAPVPSVISSTVPPQKYALYRSENPSMDEGWTRWIFEKRKPLADKGVRGDFQYVSLRNKDIRADTPLPYRAILFPDQNANQILNGYAKDVMPDEYVGGLGKEGVDNLKKYVEAGGTLVFMNRSSNFALDQIKLPVKDVTQGLARRDFYIPGSILRLELDASTPQGRSIAEGVPQQTIAWFENGPVFELTGNDKSATVIASYPSDPKQVLLSGWLLGAEKIAGKAAIVEFAVGKGKIVLFGFRPQYRGQSLATYPLLFNAMSK